MDGRMTKSGMSMSHSAAAPSAPSCPPPFPSLGVFLVDTAAIVLAYWGVSHLNFILFRDGGILPMPIWPAAAVAMTAAMMLGVAAAPGIALGAFLANAISLGASWPVALGIVVCNTAGPVYAGIRIRRKASGLPPFEGVRDVFVFIFYGVFLMAGLTATGGVASRYLLSQLPVEELPLTWLRWWLAHASGALLFTPMAMGWFYERKKMPWSERAAYAFTLALLIPLTVYLFFFFDENSLVFHGIPFLLILPLAWAAVTFSIRETMTLFSIVTILSMIGVTLGYGNPLGGQLPLVSLGFMATSYSLTLLILCAVTQERRRASAALRQKYEELLRSEDALSRAQGSYGNVVTHSPLGMHFYELHSNGRLMFLGGNPAADAILGVSNVALRGKEILEAFPILTGTEIPERYREVAATGKVWHDDHVMYEGDNIKGAFSVTAFQTEPDSMVAVFFDVTELRRAEAALQRSEAQLRLLVENSSDMISRHAPDSTILFQSMACRMLLGYEPEEMIGRKAVDFVLAEDIAGTWKIIGAAVQAKRIRYRLEQRLRKKNGDYFWTETTGRLVYGPGGGLVEIQCAVRDIEERKRADKALMESEERYRRIVNSISSYVFTVRFQDNNLIGTEHGEGCIALTGYSREEFQANQTLWIDMVHEEDRALVLQQAEAARLNRYFFPIEHRIRRKDGELRWVRNTPVPQLELDGKLLGYDGIIEDISGRKQAEEALRESEEKFSRIFRLSPEIVSITTLSDAIFLDINETFERTLGYTREETLGRSAMEMDLWVDPNDRKRIVAEIQHSASIQQHEVCLRRKDGGVITTLISGVVITLNNTPILLMMVLDITERKRIEEERQEMERRMQHVQKLESLGVLAGGIAHDFNNILMAILGHADLALMDLPPMSPVKESLGEIEKAARRAAELCRQMLAYSGKGKFIIETIDLSELVSEIVHLLRACISRKALLNLNLEKNLPEMEGDPSQIRQIAMNLITNASEAIGDRSGVITISTGAMECTAEYLEGAALREEIGEGTYVYLEVSDTGCGMDKETIGRIFEPFFTTKFTGRGLGMAAVLGIVRGHRGAIKIYSEPGKGTTFKILFPIVENPDATAENGTNAAAGSWTAEGCVLLVDDEETIRTLGKRMLTRIGFDVLLAQDGREALNLVIQQRDAIDYVLLDLTMPHMDGEEAFRELRRIAPDLHVVMSSGYTEQEITARFAGKGLAGFVQKPYTLAGLREAFGKLGAASAVRNDAPPK